MTRAIPAFSTLALPCLILLLSIQTIRAQEDGEYPFRDSFYMSEVEENLGMPQAVRVGGVVFVSGISARGADFETQMKTIYIRIQGALAQFGLTMSDVVNERIYTVDVAKLESVAELRSFYYDELAMPAFTWVQVEKLRGEGRLLEIEVMAVFGPEEG